MLSQNFSCQNTASDREEIICHLDECVTRQPSLEVWDPFVYLAEYAEKEERSITVAPGEEVDLGNTLPTVHLAVQDPMIGTVYRNYHRPALIIIFVFPDLPRRSCEPQVRDAHVLHRPMHA